MMATSQISGMTCLNSKTMILTKRKKSRKPRRQTLKSGDMFALGNHRLICGDSTDKEVVARLLGEQKVHTVYCDPPYNIALDYNKGVGGKANYGGAVDDKKTNTDFRIFLKSVMQSALSVSEKDAHHFWYCDQKYVGMLQNL
jgi:16S rRNA G966 N2-methylase RsmD